MSEEKKSRGNTSRANATNTKTTQNSKNTQNTKNAKSTKTQKDDYYYYEEDAPKTTSRASSEKTKKQVPPSEPAPETQKMKKEPDPSSVGNQLIPILLVVLSLFIVVCFAFQDDVGILGSGLRHGLFGIFGGASFLVPFLLLQIALFWRRDVATGAVKYKYLVAIFILLFTSVMVHAVYCLVTSVPKATFGAAFTWTNLKAFFTDGMNYRGGGFIGGFLASALVCAVGYPGTIIFGLLFLCAFCMALFGLTPNECWQRYRFYRHRNRGVRKVKKEEAAVKREARTARMQEEREKKAREEAARRRAREEAQMRRAYEESRTREERKDSFASDFYAQPKRRAENIDRDIFADDADFGGDSEMPAEEPLKEPMVKKESLRPIRTIEAKDEKKVKLDEIFDKKEDEEILSRFASADQRIEENEDDAERTAQMELKVERKKFSGTSYAALEELDREEKIPYFVPTEKPKKKEPTPASETEQTPVLVTVPEPVSEAKSMPTKEASAVRTEAPVPVKAEAPAPVKAEVSTPIMVTPPVVSEETSAPKSGGTVADVIAIRPPEMSVPAPAAEDDEEISDIPKPKEYEFPPIELLQEPPVDTQKSDVSAELRENADKIIRTLDSFNVRVNISNVSRGPTITRYELEPSAGTRVRSIMNLLDDIALSLATSGVRSDGIITGKSAIGIEVPNKITNTVFVRELIEDNRFESAKSKLTASLGMDVSGAPVYLDIAKMPHLLIAGATGQGKSVCINSLLISLLYKARPDEVKLILIDPKKVELNVYNGIPHLLVPVVFDPKKAAGSLHWAVQEMERRFELIEAQNVRNIAQYNAAIADDPRKEKIPQVVIIIDELADLMMSAPDDVETSICRLAQKARAAGMHLIIGTQRPSVDVITGLIKANIPSRIAFTVSSQIDSRTIIDTQGAEKLIGRGDMLFSPVGSSKPIRVQGAFVSEKEIENVVGFIKGQSTESAYSDDVMKEIEKAAAVCGQKKGKGSAAPSSPDENGDDVEEVDPMLDAAIELAVESGKISTSLIQRRLSLGYGRAAKLIDVMERRGIVSAPEGQKPRAVLITREQYLEMKMNQTDSASANDADEPPFDVE